MCFHWHFCPRIPNVGGTSVELISSYHSSQRIIFRSKFNSLFQMGSSQNPRLSQFSFGIYLTLSMLRKMVTTSNSIHLKFKSNSYSYLWSDNFIITCIGIYCLNCVSDWKNYRRLCHISFLWFASFSLFNSCSFYEMINSFIISLQFLSLHVACFIFKLLLVATMEPSHHRMDS